MPRQRFIQDPKTHKLIPIEEWLDRQDDVDAPYVMPDIQPYKSMATGEMITSRSQHRAHLKDHGLVEVGNETKYLTKKKERKEVPGLKEAIARQVYNRL